MEATYTGDYPPLPYLLPAVALSSASGWSSGLWLSRALSASACLAFILLAIAALWSGSGWSLLGPLVAITPMVLFVSSVINPTGLEATAGIAFASAGLRIVRERENSPAWTWVLLACSGAVTALAWQLGPIFVVIDLAVLAALLGRTQIREVLARSRRRSGTVTLMLIAALGLDVSWAAISGFSHSTFQVAPVAYGLRLGIAQLRRLPRDAVGVFGWHTVPMPSVFYSVWLLLVATILIGALLLGNRRERILVTAVTVLGLVMPVLFYAWVYRFSEFPLQGRYMLPLLALTPLVAGEVISRTSDRMPARTSKWLLAAAVASVAAVQLVAWWTSARAAAARQSYTWFMAHATWTPPLGWWPWVGMAIAGSAAIAASGAVGAFQGRTHAREPGLRAVPQPQGGGT